MDKRPGNFISVIVPARNAARYVRSTIQSVLNQAHREFEIVVVDDDSADDTAAIVTAMAHSDPRIRLLRTRRLGVSAARNLAIANARGDLIAPLDADDVWHREKLARQLAVLRGCGPNVGVVYNWTAGIDDNDRIVLPVWNKSFAAGNVLRDLVVTGIVGNGSTPLIRRMYIDEVGGFDVDLSLCEDWKFYTALAGVCEFAVIPECLTGYRIRSDSASMDVGPMEKAIEGVTAWIVDTWPSLPEKVLQDRQYTVQNYLAFLAIRAGDYSGAMRYLRRAFAARPEKLLNVSFIQMYFLLAGHMIGIRGFRWAFWRKPASYWDITLSEFSRTVAASIRGVHAGKRHADKGIQQQSIET